MIAFYLILLSLGGVVLFLDVALFLMFGIRELRASPAFRTRLAKLRNIQVLPSSVTMLLADCTLLGVIGALLAAGDIAWFVSLPCAVAGCITLNVTWHILLVPNEMRLSDTEIEGLEGEVIERITPELYGRVRFTLHGRVYRANATDANGHIIEAGARVLIVSRADELYFVEDIDHIYDLVDL